MLSITLQNADKKHVWQSGQQLDGGLQPPIRLQRDAAEDKARCGTEHRELLGYRGQVWAGQCERSGARSVKARRYRRCPSFLCLHPRLGPALLVPWLFVPSLCVVHHFAGLQVLASSPMAPGSINFTRLFSAGCADRCLVGQGPIFWSEWHAHVFLRSQELSLQTTGLHP